MESSFVSLLLTYLTETQMNDFGWEQVLKSTILFLYLANVTKAGIELKFSDLS